MEEGPPKSACRGRLQTPAERHWLKTVVVSVSGKGLSKRQVRYESRRRTQVNHCLGVVTAKRHQNHSPSRAVGKAQRKPVYWLGGVRRGDGASLIRARLWNWANSMSDEKERGQVKKSKAASTEAQIEGGLPCSSNEAAVMVVE